MNCASVPAPSVLFSVTMEQLKNFSVDLLLRSISNTLEAEEFYNVCRTRSGASKFDFIL